MIEAGLYSESDEESRIPFAAQIAASAFASRLYWQKYRRTELVLDGMVWFVDNLLEDSPWEAAQSTPKVRMLRYIRA